MKADYFSFQNAQDFVRVLVTMYWSTKLSTTDDPSIVKVSMTWLWYYLITVHIVVVE